MHNEVLNCYHAINLKMIYYICVDNMRHAYYNVKECQGKVMFKAWPVGEMCQYYNYALWKGSVVDWAVRRVSRDVYPSYKDPINHGVMGGGLILYPAIFG